MPATPTPAHRRKLIEVDLPLDAINAESAREKSIRHGHPSTMHLWWSRKPLAACRAVIFASLVDDSADCPAEFPTPDAQRAERPRQYLSPSAGYDVIQLRLPHRCSGDNPI